MPDHSGKLKPAEALIRKAAEMADSGIPVYFLERLPERNSELTDVKEVLNKLVQSAVILKIDELIPEMQSKVCTRLPRQRTNHI